jgi:GAF domain-containing protein
VRIAVGDGICGTAVAEARNQNVPDVTQVGNYIACSPRTRSELVVLIRSNAEILGQIDIDARDLNAFPAADQQAIEAVADKIAEAIVKERADEELLRRLSQPSEART